jgi:hypothetical protein
LDVANMNKVISTSAYILAKMLQNEVNVSLLPQSLVTN